MPKRFIPVFLLVSLFFYGPSFGFESRGQDCSKCHVLNKDEAGTLLKDLFPDLKVLEISVSPVNSLWEIYIEARGRKAIVYVDFSKKNVIWGQLVSIKDRRNLTQERLSELHRVDVSQIPLADALVMGDKDARIRVIVFHDPD